MIHRFLAASLLALSTLTVAGAQAPTITSVGWLNVNINVVDGGINVVGSNLSGVSVCKLVSTSTNLEYDLDLVRMTATTALVKLRKVSIARPPIPPGNYRVRLGTPGNTVLSAATLTVAGLTLTDFTASSVQSPFPVAEFFGVTLPFSSIVGALLRDDAGNEWRAVEVIHDPNHGQHYIAKWLPVPVGQYDIFLLGPADVPLWKSPTKFRVFANPR